jgi:hypothetical protein
VFELMVVELSTGAPFKHNKLVRMCGALCDPVFTVPSKIRSSAAHEPARVLCAVSSVL